MLYLCVLTLGVFSSLALSAVGLILLSSVLFVGLGVAGAIHHEPLLAVLLKAVAVSLTLQIGYASPLFGSLLWPQPYARTKQWASDIAAGLRSWRL